MFCQTCHDYIPEDSRFCPKCGVRLRVAVAPDPPWLWICTIMSFALTWAVVMRKELQVELFYLIAQVDHIVDVFK